MGKWINIVESLNYAWLSPAVVQEKRQNCLIWYLPETIFVNFYWFLSPGVLNQRQPAGKLATFFSCRVNNLTFCCCCCWRNLVCNAVTSAVTDVLVGSGSGFLKPLRLRLSDFFLFIRFSKARKSTTLRVNWCLLEARFGNGHGFDPCWVRYLNRTVFSSRRINNSDPDPTRMFSSVS